MKSITTEEISALISSQKRFILSMRSIQEEITGDELSEIVVGMFPPASLFAKEICDIPSVWVELRNFLDARGYLLAKHSSILTSSHYHRGTRSVR